MRDRTGELWIDTFSSNEGKVIFVLRSDPDLITGDEKIYHFIKQSSGSSTRQWIEYEATPWEDDLCMRRIA
jgi:hypothetical protein